MPNFLSDKLMSTALKCSSQLMLGALLIGILGFTSQSYAQSSEGATLDTSSHAKLAQSLEELSYTTTKADYEAMIQTLNLMVIDRSHGEVFRPLPYAVKEVGDIVHGMTPTEIIELGQSLERPTGTELVDQLYLMSIRPRTEEQSERIYSQILLIALAGSASDLKFSEDVSSDISLYSGSSSPNKKLEENVKKVSRTLIPTLEKCSLAAEELRASGQDNLSDFPKLVTMNSIIDVMADRLSNMEEFKRYRDTLYSYFSVYFSSRSDRRVCKNTLLPGLGLEEEDEKSLLLCAVYDSLNTCMTELRHEQRVIRGAVSETP